MIEIIINGEAKQLEDDTKLSSLIETLELANSRFAIELNQSVVPKSQFNNTILQSGDELEIVRAVGGG